MVMQHNILPIIAWIADEIRQLMQNIIRQEILLFSALLIIR